MVRFLMSVYGDNMNIAASIVTAQAEQNTKYIIDSLKLISNMITKWIKELEKIEKENESNKNQ
ncbi:MAG: hypothetical protein ACI4N3_04820 [Alphaproteobacteria bacterium]